MTQKNIGPIMIFSLFALSCNSLEKSNGTGSSAKPVGFEVPQDCDFEDYAMVTGSDHRCYLNKCWAMKNGIQVIKEEYSKDNFKAEDNYTWPIEQVCKPIQEVWDTIAPVDLGDGTLIYFDQELKKFRGTPNRCRCLSASTFIATPRGNRLVSALNVGDSVLTLDNSRNKVIVTIRAINKVVVESQQKILDIELADGRKLKVSPAHPIAEKFLTIGQCQIGDTLDGSVIISKTYSINDEEFTYDILPYGNSASYWANNILIASTLRGMFYTDDLLEMGW